MPGITKRALTQSVCWRPILYFPNARTAFLALLRALGVSASSCVLLPAYIGWSPHEGSGVFDPVQEVGAQFRFYRLTRELTIDLTDLARQIQSVHPKVVVLIHYFGFPDPHLAEAVALARESGALVLEDEAHALYSDLIGGVCGRFGDVAIMSLHKMLPFESGGLLVLNNPLGIEILDRLKHSPLRKPLEYNPFDYDLLGISLKRRANTNKLLELLGKLQGKVDPLFSAVPEGVVPQTLPVLILNRSRETLYFELNNKGYGVVSLYHTLIDPIRESEFPESHWLSKRILNLPVHQDASTEMLKAMIAQIEGLVA